MKARPDLGQRMALGKLLTEMLAAIRLDQLLPQAEKEWRPGARIPVMFGDRQAAWITVPKGSVEVTVTDEAAYRAWVEKHFPTEVEDVETAPQTEALLRFLRATPGGEEHIVITPEVRPGFTQKIVLGFKGARRRFMAPGGEVYAEVPGMKVTDKARVPAVALEDDAMAVIAAAWPDLDLREVLALPAAPAKPSRRRAA